MKKICIIKDASKRLAEQLGKREAIEGIVMSTNLMTNSK